MEPTQQYNKGSSHSSCKSDVTTEPPEVPVYDYAAHKEDESDVHEPAELWNAMTQMGQLTEPHNGRTQAL